MVQGGMSCIKYILALFSFVFVVFGITLIVLGSMKLNTSPSLQELVQSPHWTAILSVIIGVILFAIAFLGCCGSLRESHCMLLTFSSFLVIIILLEFIIAGTLFAFRNELPQIFEKTIENEMCSYNKSDPHSDINRLFDDFQSHYKCCGVKEAKDWFRCNEFNVTQDLPHSCCKEGNIIPNNSSTFKECRLTDAYKEGCSEIGIKLISDGWYVLSLVLLATAILQLLGIVFSCCLAYTIKKEYEIV